MTEESSLTFREQCRRAAVLVEDFLKDRLPAPNKVGYRVDENRRQQVKTRIRELMLLLDTALEKVDDLSMSYNGGKDCLVMLILTMAALYPKLDGIPEGWALDLVFINSETAFPEMTEFIKSSNEKYCLNPVPIKCDLKQGFEHYLAAKKEVKRVLIGIRHTDPYGGSLKFSQETDGDWPRFVRLHPILKWTYVDIWTFLVETGVEYCSMYDKGYTSLGGLHTTVPNPKLKSGDGFLPAYMLVDDADAQERLGRIKLSEKNRAEEEINRS